MTRDPKVDFGRFALFNPSCLEAAHSFIINFNQWDLIQNTPEQGQKNFLLNTSAVTLAPLFPIVTKRLPSSSVHCVMHHIPSIENQTFDTELP